ncbi:ABC transporter ATP-binding protein [Leptolyngbya sp. 7M]|uniref:ABC transporter ATP-binding protein n=1 Tax=Leptolyngbya sp. 7M TaxID=2812896 RepID=UPI001B8DA3AF|nr:ABC transporter ATP-binding protein [Leptolyngbya sp. 7M]QYO65673.1 ABC transporter ATP-binding protein [Leptolyngbya sp. 7M]
MLSVKDITIRYGPCDVLSNISFDMREGEMIALLGPNGAGKTTLIKALNGILPVAEGDILLDEKPLGTYSRREIAKRIAVVAQENETKFPVTVLEFVLSGRFASGSAFGWESEDDIESAKRALSECDLADFGSRLMNELSGGERQRVVLARAIATDAKILLLDEPTANLDLRHQAMMFRLVRERCDSEDYSAVVITHDLNLAAEFANKLLLLKQGTIYVAGAATDVLTGPNIREVFGVNTLLDINPASGNVRVTNVF